MTSLGIRYGMIARTHCSFQIIPHLGSFLTQSWIDYDSINGTINELLAYVPEMEAI